MDALRPLSLDQFAAMTAEMEAGIPRDRVLAGGDVSAEQWDLTQETWLLRMAKQGAQRKLALLDRYNELLAKHRKAAQRKMRAEKRKLKGPMPVAPEAHLSALARRQDGDGTGATFQRPSFADAPDQGGFVAPVVPGVAPDAVPAWLGAGAPPPVAGVPAMVGAPAMVGVPAMAGVPAVVGAMALGAESAPAPGGAAPEATGPAWLQPKRQNRTLATTAASEVLLPPTAVAGPAWLATKTAPRADGAPPPVASLPSNPAIAGTAGPAWLRSNPSLPVDLTQTGAPQISMMPAAAASPPVESETRAGFGVPTAGSDRAAWIAALDRPSSDGPPAQAAAPAPVVATHLPFAEARSPEDGRGLTSSSGGVPPWIAALAQSQAQAQRDAAAAQSKAADVLPFQRAAQPAVQAAAQPAAQPAQHPARAAAHPGVQAAQHPAQAQPAPQHAQPAAQHARPAVQPAQVAAQPAQVATAAAQVAGPAAQVAAPRLSIEQLAWLQAQIDTSVELGRSAREKLGLSEVDYASERTIWQVKFQQDRTTVERYSQLFYHYRRTAGTR